LRDKNLGQTMLNWATFLDATEKSHIEDQNPTSQRVFFQQPDAIPETPHCQRDVSTRIQGEIVRWHCAARREIADVSASVLYDAAPSFKAKAHAGIARRGGRSPSAARKLPQQGPRSPREMTRMGKPKRGASGGMQGGPRRGRSPITGPALPPPEAAQTTNKKRPPCPQGTEAASQRTSPALFLQSARRAYPRPPAGGGPN